MPKIGNRQEIQTDSRLALLLEIDKMLFSMAYVEGFKQFGQGAIISNTKGKSRFVSTTITVLS
ncbi:hypothetical protein HC931_25520 [Candidatus Gracilibacteria bacterium]|nr:hypothetical protein [Candidatus Gracilibacteria bacterium]NJM90438.1 hypothetical protein [Hydrococcus sp. RU_2_2]NJP21866.1 hypothetical protein [Hydrococcus sp. CRU_1_1]